MSEEPGGEDAVRARVVSQFPEHERHQMNTKTVRIEKGIIPCCFAHQEMLEFTTVDDTQPIDLPS